MHYLNGLMSVSGHINWQFSGVRGTEEGLRVAFNFSSHRRKLTRRNALESTVKAISSNNLCWIKKLDVEWKFDLDALRESFDGLDELKELKWFKGAVIIEPEFESEELDDNNRFNPTDSMKTFRSSVCFYITPELKRSALNMSTNEQSLLDIQTSINNFRADYPNTVKTAFIMMQFSNTKAHTSISNEVKRVLTKHGIIGLRADDKEYSDDLFANIKTYMHCCDFGIAVFERLLADTFNPNVSLEVGYMMGINKPVCLLKDATLKGLNTDLVGKLYKSFDTQDICRTLEPELEKWLSDRNFI